MERNIIKTQSDQKNAGSLNESLVFNIIAECLHSGVEEFCLCPGARNSAFVDYLSGQESVATYYHYEERAAAFFALGRAKATGRAAAIITTSGTAAGEVLPAVMEAHYSGIPLLVITADRPSHFRGSGAPQCAEQVGLFGVYTSFSQDIEGNTPCQLRKWDQRRAAHLNVCLEEKYSHCYDRFPDMPIAQQPEIQLQAHSYEELLDFLQMCRAPMAIVSALPESAKERVVRFLLGANIPVYCEAVSGIRNDPRLEPLRIRRSNKLWDQGYPIDGILRIGGVPTLRLWRDLENKEGQIRVCSLSHLPFSGLSWGKVILTDFQEALPVIKLTPPVELFLKNDRSYTEKLQQLLEQHPNSEPGMVYRFSNLIQKGDLIYLGNSMPIREWDLAANYQTQELEVLASRGLNGIDGQLSTFFGVCRSKGNNWCLLGDLTTLYDLAAPWILPQLKAQNVNILVMNNSGGRIFERLFANPLIQNQHNYTFEPVAKLWGLHYEQWHAVPNEWKSKGAPTLIECFPDHEATERFWNLLS